MADEQSQQPQLKIATEKAIVARGRSIDIPVEGKRIQVGTTEDNRKVTRVPIRKAGPGEEVELPADEVRRLRASGFLIDPTNLAPPVGLPGVNGDGPGQVRAA
jgi:hypothetical protein